MPLVSDQLENIAKLPPFDILLDHLDERVENANIEMCPDVDLSEEATFEFYEEEDFKYETKPDYVDPDSNRPGLNEERLPSGGNQVTIERDAGEDLRTRTDADLPDCEASYFFYLKEKILLWKSRLS